MRALALACTLAAILAAPAPAAGPADPGAGALYATVTTDDGRELTGFLRNGWDTWWDDVFKVRRPENPWLEHVDLEALAAERRAAYFREHGLFDRLAYVLGGEDEKLDAGLLFLCRYGQIARIDRDRDGATVTVTDGTTHAVRPRGVDLGGDLLVVGPDSTEIDWDEIRSVVFAQAPAGAAPPWRRLRGTVRTADGPLEGWIRWDESECTDRDVLDGEADGTDHELPMGTIAAIAKDRDGALVERRDGTRLHLTGTNDVNADNRGIAVSTADRGWVTVPWRHFVRVEFAPPGGPGPARAAFPAGAELHGTVTDADGRRHEGRLVWDLDEGWTWDLLNGERDGVEYELPFGDVRRIVPGPERTRVELRGGAVLELDAGVDVSGDNHGLLVVGPDGVRRLAWAAVAEARFAE